jgi:hypothetical protein
MAIETGRAIDQQAAAAVGAHVAERDRLSAVGLRAPFRRRVVAGSRWRIW